MTFHTIATAQDACTEFESLARQATLPRYCLRIKVPLKRVHSFTEILQTEKTVWLPESDAAANPADWQIAGLGCAVALSATEATRFSQIREMARHAFSSTQVIHSAPASHFPNLRFLGGGAFAPGSLKNSVWSGFGDARFIIPRWQYATQSGDASLQLVIDAGEFQNATGWREELSRIFNWLNRIDTMQMPSTESVNITHYSNGWETLVNDALTEIRNGTLKKVVVSRMSHLRANLPYSLPRVLERLERSYADCMRFTFTGADGLFVGATPEQLVRVSDSGKRIAADALAGSAQRTGATDSGALHLQHSEKERREFTFVLDNIESQLISLGVRITSNRHIKIKSLKNLFHLHCPVTGVTDSPMHILQLVEKLHPTPAVCGTPTPVAAQWLIRNEHQPRGWYAGPIGWFDETGDGCFAVGIRSALIKQNDAWLFAGAGIVEGSSAAVEFTETGAKLTPMLGALGAI